MPDAVYADRYLLRARYEQEGCFGRCPIYKLSLYDNGLLIYEGGRFADKEGNWQKVLSRSTFTEVMEEFDEADFARFPQAFPSAAADLATKYLLYYDKAADKTYTTSWKEASTPKLEIVASRMRQLAEQQGYKEVTTELKPSETLIGTNRQVVDQELIIQLENGVTPEAWVVRYGPFNLRYKSRVSPNRNYYVFLADPSKLPVDEQLEMYRQDKDVLGAQMNKQVSPRE